MENIRNPVTKREIVKYLKLREMRIRQGIFEKDKSEEEIAKLKKRHSEIVKLLQLISKDTIRKEINKMQKHRFTEYKRIKQKE